MQRDVAFVYAPKSLLDFLFQRVILSIVVECYEIMISEDT